VSAISKVEVENMILKLEYEVYFIGINKDFRWIWLI